MGGLNKILVVLVVVRRRRDNQFGQRPNRALHVYVIFLEDLLRAGHLIHLEYKMRLLDIELSLLLKKRVCQNPLTNTSIHTNLMSLKT